MSESNDKQDRAYRAVFMAVLPAALAAVGGRKGVEPRDIAEAAVELAEETAEAACAHLAEKRPAREPAARRPVPDRPVFHPNLQPYKG